MSKPAKQSEADDEQPVLSVRDWNLDATAAARTQGAAEVPAVASHMKPFHDLAFAVAMRDSILLTEGQLSLATRDWTAFGSTTLADHLIANSLSTREQAQEVKKVADELFQRASRNASTNRQSSESTPQSRLIAALNPDGRLASMLGLTGKSTLVGAEIEDRSIGARYTLLRKLGQGGLGTVWLARDENLNRYVAIKELTSDAGEGDVALEHFRREAEITGRLEHPGIVPIHQFGRDEKTGKAFYAMRFLGRRTLQDAIDEYHERRESGSEDTMLLHRLLSSFVSVCHSVSHAHGQKVIHRDLKPANVALDEFGQVTLLDWGLSKVNEETGMYDVAGRSEPGDLHDLHSGFGGRVIGTPLYMAPEQAAGRLQDVDALTDVYGLGGILYAILTGVGPHHASGKSTDTAIGREQFLSRIVADEAIAPNERSQGVPPELNAICAKALSRQRYRRYQSAADLAEDVQRYMAGAPVQAYEAPLKRRFTRWMVHHPTLAQMSLLSASLVLITLVAVALTARNGRERLIASRYASAAETAHDMEVNLQFEASALERDLHFITDLPLMSAITQSQEAYVPASSAEEDDASSTVEQAAENELDREDSTITEVTPEVWLDRQGELFDGVLGANPAYLMMTSCVREDVHRFRELVRSERVSAGQPAMRIPKRQLRASDAVGDEEDVEFTELLRPGAVVMETNDQLSEDIPTHHRSALVLSGVSAIYDPDGNFFGLNVIELDLRERLTALIPAIAPEYVNVFVTDSAGHIVMDYRDGRFIDVPGTRLVSDEFPAVQSLYDSTDGEREMGDGRQFYAKLVELGQGASQAHVGIVTSISEAAR